MENFYKNNNFLFYPIFYFLEKLNLYPNMMGTANTALWKGFPSKKWINRINPKKITNEIIYALNERDKPYLIDIDFTNKKINTIKKINTNSAYFSAHPKIFNNKTYSCVYNIFKPEIMIYEYDESFNILNKKKITTNYVNMIHDIAITENYIIFFDIPFTFNINNIFSQKMPFIFDKTKKNKIVLVNRNLSSDSIDSVRFIDCNDTFFVFHYMDKEVKEINNTIILDTIIHNDFNLDFTKIKNNSYSKYRRFIINKEKLTYEIKKNNFFEELNLEFPSSNNEYSILSIFDKGLDINGFIITKNFIQIKKKLLLNRKIYAEPVITDTNCIICFTYDEKYNSYLYIYDIKANKNIEIKLDVPMIKGFHSIFIAK
jgi:carotenoid cleavage dioxygenase-like enzyme